VKRLLLVGALVVVAAFAAAGARADGDPASDILYVQDVFVPYPKPSADAVTNLTKAVATANAGGLKLKVAVLATEFDMGTARSLFNRPTDYAKFLGTELAYNYDGLLLVVMPAGFGVFKKDADTTRYENAVAPVSIDRSGPDGLMQSATTAVRRLISLGIKDADHTPPTVHAFSAHAKRGARLDLTYDVNDNSSRSREVVRIYAGTHVAATLRSPLEVTRAGILDAVRWRAPAHPVKTYRFCVVATDPAGNASRSSCASIRIL
jgi:hypothetical protein